MQVYLLFYFTATHINTSEDSEKEANVEYVEAKSVSPDFQNICWLQALTDIKKGEEIFINSDEKLEEGEGEEKAEEDEEESDGGKADEEFQSQLERIPISNFIYFIFQVNQNQQRREKVRVMTNHQPRKKEGYESQGDSCRNSGLNQNCPQDKSYNAWSFL